MANARINEVGNDDRPSFGTAAATVAAVNPSRTRNRVSIAGYAIVAVVAVVVLAVLDSGGLRIAMTLVIISAGLGIVLAVYQLRRSR